MSYYEDKVIRVCDANKRFELFGTEPISGYIALSKISLVFNFYNIKTPQEVLFYEKGKVLVESKTSLEEYKAEKKKLTNDVAAAMVAYLARNKELKIATANLTRSDVITFEQYGFFYYEMVKGHKVHKINLEGLLKVEVKMKADVFIIKHY